MQKITTHMRGKQGESYAKAFLISQNYMIIAENFRSKFGEIDVIAIDQGFWSGRNRHHATGTNYTEPELAFIEVKTRTSLEFGTPESAVTLQKRQKIIKTALHFFSQASRNLPQTWRIDVISVQLNRRCRNSTSRARMPPQITHFKNI